MVITMESLMNKVSMNTVVEFDSVNTKIYERNAFRSWYFFLPTFQTNSKNGMGIFGNFSKKVSA